jgi:uncharacterized protein (DUF1499 family)
MRHAHAIRLGIFVLALAAAAAAMLAGLGTRWGLWHFRFGFMILTWAAYAALIAAILSLFALFLGRLSTKALVMTVSTIVVGSVVAGLPWYMKQQAKRVPAIHDISTDVQDPPLFVAILPLRKDAPNPAAYCGPAIATQQRQAYPEIVPLVVEKPPQEAFQKASDTARKMGWRIVDTNELQGRIEATDTTFWFGFKDDVVVRVAPVERGSRIDVRSVSRVGKSDVGTNASRIRDYLARLRKALS